MNWLNLLWEIPLGAALAVGLVAGMLRDVRSGSLKHTDMRHRPRYQDDDTPPGRDVEGDAGDTMILDTALTARALNELDDMFK